MNRIKRSERLLELMIENKRNQLIKKIIEESKGVVVKSFVSILETEEINKKVYEKIDALSNYKTIDKKVQTIINILLSKKQHFTSFFDKDVVLFHQLDRETGAIILKLEYIFKDLEYILHFVGYSKDYRDLIIVSPDLKFGICSERFEYDNKLTIWGI